MNPEERKELIAQYSDGYRTVSEALHKASPEDLAAKPSPSAWSAKEIVHHLADSEMIAAVRFRRLLAEDRPHFQAFDQDEFARHLHYDRSYELSLDLFKAVRASTAELMATLSESEWLREGTHEKIGRFGMDAWLQIYAPHAQRHADQIRAARTAATTAAGSKG
ncbi:MAG TPA: DinB family protein [Vicinamibacterales bacterium]|nr:DinB family protein [Vicinamibacterales bacterium]